MITKALIVIYFFLPGSAEELYVRINEKILMNWQNESSNEWERVFEIFSNNDMPSGKKQGNSVINTSLRKSKQTIVIATRCALIRAE